MTLDIETFHHVGHVVRKMEEGLALYRRLGFRMSAPAYPMLSRQPGAAPEPFGVANSHAELTGGQFLEVVACLDAESGVPSDAKLVPLTATQEQLGVLTASIGRTIASLSASLARFEGMHILALQSANVDVTAARLDSLGVTHGGVHTVKRPVGTTLEVIRFLEMTVPEGRVAVAEQPLAAPAEHPNGALGLVEMVLSAEKGAVGDIEHRYEMYLGRPAQADGACRVFTLGNARLVLVADEDLDSILPGERAPALPAFVGFAVAVRDFGATRAYLEQSGVVNVSRNADTWIVPSRAALGVAVGFRYLR